jgi:hypothetical protein
MNAKYAAAPPPPSRNRAMTAYRGQRLRLGRELSRNTDGNAMEQP